MENNVFDVCAGWIADNPVIGRCFVESARGSSVISFEYSRDWLHDHPAFILDPALYPMAGRQYPPSGRETFGFLEDASPDRWGRLLMDRNAKLNHHSRRLNHVDYLLGVSDSGRQGGLRLRTPDGAYIASEDDRSIPPMARLRELEAAARSFEHNETDGGSDLKLLLNPGSSLGGARPKANVISESGELWIAKFPSKYDSYNVGAWEMSVHDLVKRCGLRVPPAKLLRLSDYGDTFLVRRFDREKDGNRLKRTHFVSAMTLLGLTDGQSDTASYLDLLSVIEQYGRNVQTDAKELWSRLVFNICIGNCDDHLRNHGFLVYDNGIELSPVYDVNPSPDRNELSLSIDTEHYEKNLQYALDVSEYFRMTGTEAVSKLDVIRETVHRYWRSAAKSYGISQSETELMRDSFSAADSASKMKSHERDTR